jgi:hypothetical protein
MTSLPLKQVTLAFHLSGRAAAVTGVYLASAAAVLLTVILLRAQVPPSALSRFLGFVVIASLSAGLEPGTVKAAALDPQGARDIPGAAFLAAGALKAIAASPVLALLWRFADPDVPAGALAWTPALAIAGFCATDLRTGLDLRGRYAVAIGLKQGSLAGGVALAGCLIAVGASLPGAVAASCLARLAFLGLAAHRAEREGSPWRGGLAHLGGQVRRLLGDRRWIDLAAVSAIAAASGGADRLFGLRYLSPAAFGGYYLTCELFSRFWLIPYLLSPIVFARRASGVPDDGFARAAWGLLGAAGAAYLAITAGLLLLAPGLVRQVIGPFLGAPTLAFVAAVVVNSFSQLRVAELQSVGRSRRAAVAIAASAGISIPLFYLCARGFGGSGLLWAWLAKSVLELAVLTIGKAPTWRGDEAARAGR